MSLDKVRERIEELAGGVQTPSTEPQNPYIFPPPEEQMDQSIDAILMNRDTFHRLTEDISWAGHAGISPALPRKPKAPRLFGMLVLFCSDMPMYSVSPVRIL